MTNERYQELKSKVSKLKDSVAEWADALREIKASGKWKAEAANWECWCLEHAGVTAAALRMQDHRERKRLNPPPEEKTERNVSPSKTNAPEPKPTEKAIEVTATIDKQASFPEPHKPPSPSCETPFRVRSDLNGHLEELIRCLDRISHLPMPADLVRPIQHALCEAKKVQLLLQPTLPMEVESSKKRSRGSLEEVITYCLLVKLTREDGEWFFHKCVGCAWKNNGLPINDWQATVNAWRIQKIFPSQKNQTYGSQTYRGNTPQSHRNDGTTPRPEGQPDYGEAARRKQELQSANAARNRGVA